MFVNYNTTVVYNDRSPFFSEILNLLAFTINLLLFVASTLESKPISVYRPLRCTDSFIATLSTCPVKKYFSIDLLVALCQGKLGTKEEADAIYCITFMFIAELENLTRVLKEAQETRCVNMRI